MYDPSEFSHIAGNSEPTVHPELVEGRIFSSPLYEGEGADRGLPYTQSGLESLSLFPDIAEFALRKSIVRALKIFHGLRLNWKIWR
jgi:hypothetical protein